MVWLATLCVSADIHQRELTEGHHRDISDGGDWRAYSAAARSAA
jgi:hypothetical protein